MFAEQLGEGSLTLAGWPLCSHLPLPCPCLWLQTNCPPPPFKPPFLLLAEWGINPGLSAFLEGGVRLQTILLYSFASPRVTEALRRVRHSSKQCRHSTKTK